MINSQAAQNISHISAGGTGLFLIPLSHTTTFDQDTGNTAGSCMIIRATGSHTRLHHIRHIYLLRHFPGLLNHFFISFTCIVYVWGQFFVIISAVKINVVICNFMKILFHRPGQTFHLCSFRISRKFPIQVFTVRQPHTSAARFKGQTIDHFHNDNRALNFFNLQLMGQFYGSLDTHILSCMNTSCDQNGFPFFLSMQDGHRKMKFTQIQITADLFPRLCTEISQFERGILRFFCSTNHKHRCRAIVQLFFFTPYSLPDSFICRYTG